MRIAVIGLGLIGGSVALAARERAGAHVVAWDPDAATLDAAVSLGVIDSGAGSLASAVQQVDAVFIAAPVGALSRLIGEVLALVSPDCVVTDVGSTKRAVVGAHTDERFVGGHPLAGAETAGIEHARADLFDGATWYLTPTQTTEGILYERLYRLLGSLGARPVAIDADTHDRLLALVSHLPHVFANVLVAQATSASAANSEPLPVVGPSFRDATRVAGANSGIWTDIYISNRDALVGALDDSIARLAQVRDALARADAAELTRWNDAAAADRRALVEADRGAGELHELRVPVPNRPGVVAQLALELGRAGVNISDLALYPAPDMSEGVVAIWVSGAENAQRAQKLISELGLSVLRP